MVSRKQRKPLDTVLLPQFPNNPTLSMEPTTEVHTNIDDKGDFIVGKNPGESDYVITNLTASDESYGTLVVTAQSRTGSGKIEHHLLDVGRREVTRTIFQTQNVDCLPVYGIAASHNYMTCLGAEGTPPLFVYNLRETPKKSRGQKRPKDGIPLKAAEDVSWSSRIDPVLKDRHGLQTQMTCIAMNRNGTAILGGSSDGDLFVWRGS
jgi:hypothetical protein